MAEFNVNVDGKETPIAQAPWLKPEYKAKLDISKEIFIRVEWKSFVEDSADGYWEKGMTSVPLVAYMLNDQTTHKKVRQHFGYKD